MNAAKLIEYRKRELDVNIDSSGIAAATAGGLLIGLSAGGLYLTRGRIAGISGIWNGLFARNPAPWRIAFVVGLVLAGLGARLMGVKVPGGIGAGPVVLAIAGLLVGFGTRLGNGCTSGHGVCGLARLSQRSLVAVAVFMFGAVVTVFVIRHGGVK